MSDRLGGERGDPGLERFEIIGQGVAFLTGPNLPDSLELERELAFGQMGAEDMKDRGSGQDSQLGPDGKEPLRLAEQTPGLRVGTPPGDVSAQVEPGHQARPRGPGSTVRPWACRQVAAEEDISLGVRPSRRVEPTSQLAGDVPRTLDQGAHRQIAPKEPVQAGNVSAHVAAHEDRTPPSESAESQMLLAVHAEPAPNRLVGRNVKPIVASQKACRVRRQGRPLGLDRSVKIQHLLRVP